MRVSEPRTFMVSVLVDVGNETPLYLMEKNLTEWEAEMFAEDLVKDAAQGIWPMVYNTYINPERIVTVRVTEEREDTWTDRGRSRSMSGV